MISSLTDLANDALNAINSGTITSIDGTDKLAKLCTRYMDLAFEQTISKGKFTACTTISTLALSTDDPIIGYAYCYHLPARAVEDQGYIKALKLESEVDYDMRNGKLSTSDPAAKLVYLYRPYNLGLYPQVILDCVAMKLATLICMEIVPDQNRLILARTRFVSSLKDAMTHNRSERHGLRRKAVMWSDAGNELKARLE